MDYPRLSQSGSFSGIGAGGPRKSITDKLWEQGRRVSAATLKAGDRLISKAASGLTDCQKFVQCARLTDVNNIKLTCVDEQMFESVITQYSLSEQFGDVPFLVTDTDSDLPMFKAILTQKEGFILQELTGDFIYTVTLCPEDKNFLPGQASEGYQQQQQQQQPHHKSSLGSTGGSTAVVGKVKSALGVTMYRLVRLVEKPACTSTPIFPRGGDLNKALKYPQFYAVVKINEEKEYYVKIRAKNSLLYRLAKFFGFAMDSRVFECSRSDQLLAKIRPKLGWNRRNVGYCVQYNQECKNFTLKTVCLGFAMWAFLKYSPIEFQKLMTS